MSSAEEMIDSQGRRISQRELYKSLGMTTLAGSFGGMWLAMTYGMPLIMFMQSIGASGLAMGLVATVRQLVMCGQIPAALATEHLATRKPFWWRCAAVHRLLWFVAAGMACWCPPSSWWLPFALVALVGVSDFLGNASAAPWFAWMADLIPAPISGRFWGLRQTVVTVATLAGLVLASQVLDAARRPGATQAEAWGFAVVFAIAAVFGIADIVVHYFVREPRTITSGTGEATIGRIAAPFLNRNFLFLTLSLGIWNFGLTMVAAFSLVYLKRDFGVSYSQLASLSIAGALGAIVTGYALGHLMDRIGARLLTAIFYLLTPLAFAPWLFVNMRVLRFGPFAFPQSIVILCVSNLVTGAINSAVWVCEVRLATEHTSARGRTMSMAVHWTFVGLVSALGPTAGGLVMDHFHAAPWMRIASGLPVSFFHAQLAMYLLLLWLAGLPLLLAIRGGTERINLDT